MRTIAWRLAVPLVLLGVACSRGSSGSDKVSGDLQSDLSAAQSASLQLANGSQGYQTTRVVSAIEQGETAKPVQRRPSPKPVVSKQAAAEPQQEKAPDPAPQATVEVAKAPEPEQPAPVADAPSVPIVAPRPAPVPVEYPGSGGSRGTSGAGPGTDIGTIIGVILGGGVGDDHCVPRTGPRTGGRFPPVIIFGGGRRGPTRRR